MTDISITLMDKYFHIILDYFLKVLVSTGTQLLILFGPLLILAFIMNFIAQLNEEFSYKVFGRTIYLYVFGWLGTSVHELGHALFALIFGHHINQIVLFSPNAEAGSLGHVNHSFNKKSIYQNIGNFFIGIGPILLGALALFLVTYALYQYSVTEISFQFGIESFKSLSALKQLGFTVYKSGYSYISIVLFGAKTTWWKIVLLCYFLFSIGSSITLSPADIKSAFKGFLYFIVVLLLFNLATLWIGNFMLTIVAKVSFYFSVFYFLMILSIIVNIVFLFGLLLVSSIKSIFIK